MFSKAGHPAGWGGVSRGTMQIYMWVRKLAADGLSLSFNFFVFFFCVCVLYVFHMCMYVSVDAFLCGGSSSCMLHDSLLSSCATFRAVVICLVLVTCLVFFSVCPFCSSFIIMCIYVSVDAFLCGGSSRQMSHDSLLSSCTTLSLNIACLEWLHVIVWPFCLPVFKTVPLHSLRYRVGEKKNESSKIILAFYRNKCLV